MRYLLLSISGRHEAMYTIPMRLTAIIAIRILFSSVVDNILSLIGWISLTEKEFGDLI